MWKKFINTLFRTRAVIIPKNSRKMERVAVRIVPDEERMCISLEYGLEGKKQKEFNMHRLKEDELSVTLERLNCSLLKKLSNQLKKKNKPQDDDQQEQNDNFSIALFDKDEEEVQPNVSNIEAWKAGSVLQINDRKFYVQLNVPSIQKIRLPESLLSGYAVNPYVDAEFADLKKCQYVWYKSINDPMDIDIACTSEAESEASNMTNKRKRKHSQNMVQWKEVANSYSYLPNNSDVGSKLKVVCTPSDGLVIGRESDCTSKFQVSAGPAYCPFESRHKLTMSVTDANSLRVVSYNILADVYTDSEFSRNYLFPYCPGYALKMDYRKHLIIKELLGYNADIVCLQEVDQSVFIKDLYPSFESSGFDGMLKKKSTSVGEGMATFFRTSKFRLVDEYEVKMTESLKEDHKELWGVISKSEKLKKKLEERTSIVQICILESIIHPNKYVIIGNTHLFFHPRSGNIRILQAFVCMKHLSKLYKSYIAEGKDATVMCIGDMNSWPRSGAVELIEKGKVPATHADWFSGGTEELISQVELSHDLQLTSACGYPEYTNYVTGFHGCIDYIFVEKEKVKLKQVIPLPSHEEVIQYTALPNPVFGSDHLALVCDLTWL